MDSLKDKPVADTLAYGADPERSPSVASLSKREDGDATTHRGGPPLQRRLQARHSSMIAIGGGMGTGLIIGIASPLSNAGPGSLFLGFLLMGTACWAVMGALGEMACYRPDARGFPGYATRYVDPAFGFAMGWNYVIKYLVVIANNLNACALVISYWDSSTSAAVYISVIAAVILAINMLNVRVFGEIEFWLSGIKLLVVVGLIILNIVICLGGGPTHDRIGFRYWQDGLAFREYKAEGSLGRFLGFWSTLSPSLFAYIGTELVCVTVGETSSPRDSLSKAIRQTLFRILFCYIGGVFTVGLVVPSNSPELLSAAKAGTSATASPFVVAIKLAKIKVLPGIINGCLLIFTSSAANSDQYISARTLHSLALVGQAPRWLADGTTKHGVPWKAICLTFPFFALAYINLAEDGSKTFGYLSSSVSIFGGLMWWGLLLTHIRFMGALRVQGISRETLPYRAPLQPYLSYVAFFLVTLVLIFKGFYVFIGTFAWQTFITSYIGIPVFAACYLGWKFYWKTSIVSLREIDLFWVENEQELDD